MPSRRQLLAAGGLGVAGALASATHAVNAADANDPPIDLRPGSRILFQGDSITDAGRNRGRQKQVNDFAMLGGGYARLIAYHLLSKHADKELKIYNRGMSGHKVPDLEARWEYDTLDLKPDILSILIGVNDFWHKLNGQYDGSVRSYAEGYTALLKRTKRALPETKIIVCEPFVLRYGAVDDAWFPEFDKRRAAARQAAESINALFVPFQSMFNAAVEAGSAPSFWARDGVHPSEAGAALMAMRWLSETGLA